MRVAVSVCNGTADKYSLSVERESYNLPMDCANSGPLRNVLATLARASAAVSSSPERHGVPAVGGANDKSARAAVR